MTKRKTRTISMLVMLSSILGCGGTNSASSDAGVGVGAAGGAGFAGAGSAGVVAGGAGAGASGGVGDAVAGAAGDGTGSLDAAVSDDASGGGPFIFDGGMHAAQPLVVGPTYKGSVSGATACDDDYATTGFAPVSSPGERHPLFLYFVGTIFSSSDQSSKYDCKAGAAVTEAMARRGFVALSVEYDNGLSLQFDGKLSCLYGTANAASLLARACAMPEVDCNLGIATWGHSQGALVAHAASIYDSRVRAVWTTGYGGFAGATLAKNRLRVVNGEADTMNSAHAKLNESAGFSSTDCPDDGRTECLRADGSGWIIVKKADCSLTSADHCWFSKINCAASEETLEPNWIDQASTAAFALEANADWVAQTVARP